MSGYTTGVTGRRHRLGIDVEAQAPAPPLGREVIAYQRQRAVVVDHAVCRAREQGQVIRLARVRDGVGTGEQGAGSGQGVYIGRGGVTDDLRVGLVILDDDDDMVRTRDRVARIAALVVRRRGRCRPGQSGEHQA